MSGEQQWFRALLGLLAVVGSLAAFGALFLLEIPARNENALMFAMGVIFGWGSGVFASEYGASNIGRKVAEGAVKRMDRGLAGPPPKDVKDAAEQVAHAADEKKDEIVGDPM